MSKLVAYFQDRFRKKVVKEKREETKGCEDLEMSDEERYGRYKRRHKHFGLLIRNRRNNDKIKGLNEIIAQFLRLFNHFLALESSKSAAMVLQKLNAESSKWYL